MNCELCSGQYASWAIRGDGKSVVRCRKCGLMRLEIFPEPDEIAKWYSDEGYYSDSDIYGYDSSYLEYVENRYNDENSWPFKLHEHIVGKGWISPKGKLLDIGCGAGLFSGCLKKLGWAVQGVDMNPLSAEMASEYGLPVKVCAFENSGFSSDEFDLINANDFIEHVTSPDEIFSEMERILKKGGVLLLSTMNGDRSILRRSNWSCFQSSYEHLWFFNGRSLRKISERHGFEVLQIRYIDLNPGWIRGYLFPLFGLGNIIQVIARKK
ncbi:MAG: hypothetical protein CVV64_12965 [Candidatus Wallbacteria bacterium HGW-Wallbacteria-1]|jgi:2-polyprenyl-3-methyl-5-hydroxy-6-metoxy-1,4-benzoquinol methylase|uniref:Class I SAM-dependent methyltransferase n=1 Tax=Candidatus Wallbacteria bacterium HGW-Wallbacteria-1 TaxID=2013854 RepID=A0A2N1PN14_9BACT|nr:MAG: hypothetical protein CVV64_12965 [Candidatus Wallbacteria bacterium HGW-Wallbacteria-1]